MQTRGQKCLYKCFDERSFCNCALFHVIHEGGSRRRRIVLTFERTAPAHPIIVIILLLPQYTKRASERAGERRKTGGRTRAHQHRISSLFFAFSDPDLKIEVDLAREEEEKNGRRE